MGVTLIEDQHPASSESARVGAQTWPWWLALVLGLAALAIGSGPGVGTCELARLFPDAQVVAVDGSPAMLDRTTRRAAAQGLDRRVTTHLAELPGGLDGLAHADVIWATRSTHSMRCAAC